MMLRNTSLLLSLLLLAGLALGQGLDTSASKDDWEEINFEFNSSVLSDGYPSLLRLAELLSKNPDYRVRLEGNTDWIGSERYNEKLGMARANTVKSFLVKYGARSEQIAVVTQGKKKPKVDNRSKEGRFMNRRVYLTVTDGAGRTVGAGGVGDAIKAMAAAPVQPQPGCCEEILKRLDRLDDILAMLKDLRGENSALKKELEDLRKQQDEMRARLDGMPKPAAAPAVVDISRKTAAEAVEEARMKRFSLLGLNVGADANGDLTFTGSGRYFAPFKENFAIQAQGEYMYWRDRQEGQFDFGLVNRIRNFQGGLFSSFKHVNLREYAQGGTLGQAAVTLDYLFKQGRVGVFGTKGFLDDVVVNRRALSRNVFDETYLKLVDQVGGSTSLGLFGKSYVEANLAYLNTRGGDNKPGGTIRFVQPISDRWAFTLEGGFNETLIRSENTGRVVAGLQFGNFIRPTEFVGLAHPVPADVPRVRYELLTRRVRTGNDAPIADAGGDQIGVAAGTRTLDGSASYDPDGDPITFQWSQVAGPAVSLSGANTARATFTAAEGQVYGFRLLVKDDKGAQSLARATVTTAAAATVQIVRFSASPATIRVGQTSTIVWQVLNADEVTITNLGRVDPRSGTSSVAPGETTMYRLTAKNRTSEANETVTITVERPEVRILSFQAIPTNITAGEASTLSWRTENADTVAIAGVGNVDRNGATPVSPEQTTTYTLTARNVYGQVSATATVTVTPGAAPRILQFAASPSEVLAGESSTLTWQVEGADEVEITTIGKTTLGGTRQVSPAQTTTYMLVARNRNGEASSSATVTVIQPASVSACSANPGTSAKPGDPVTLSWVAQNAIDNTVSGLGSVPLGGPVTVRPAADTSYTITVIGRRNQASCQVNVKVTPAPPQPPQPPPVTNQPPTVTISGAPIIETIYRQIPITAVATDPDGDTLTYSWRSVRSQAAVLNASSATATVQLPENQGDWEFEVTVTDSKGASATARVVVRLLYARQR